MLIRVMTSGKRTSLLNSVHPVVSHCALKTLVERKVMRNHQSRRKNLLTCHPQNFTTYLRQSHALKISVCSWNAEDILANQHKMSLISSLTKLHSLSLTRQSSLLEFFTSAFNMYNVFICNYKYQKYQPPQMKTPR